MPAKRLALILVPTGKKSSIPSYFIDVLKTNKNHLFNVESEIQDALGANSMREAIANHSRLELENVWRTVIDDIVGRIAKITDDSGLVIITAHTLYYNSNTREFFSVFDANHLRKRLAEKPLEISRTALVIDDIYDSLAMLTGEKELYSHVPLYHFMLDYARVMQLKSEAIQNNAKAYMSWIHHCVSSILKWRSYEAILAHSIARDLSSDFILWGLKQDLGVLLKWLGDVNTKLFYISHPISDPRRFYAEKGHWPKRFVDTINSMQTELARHGMLTVMPTAIDEYRLEKKRGKYTTKLTARWPLPTHLENSFLDHELIPKDKDIDHTEILMPYEIEFDAYKVTERKKTNLKAMQDYVNGVMNTLEMGIQDEIGNRDHHLVWFTKGIIVIDPYSIDDKKIHGGVKKELQYIKSVNQTLKRQGSQSLVRRLCAVFLMRDAKTLINANSFHQGHVEKLRVIVRKNHQLSDEYSPIVNKKGDLDIPKINTLGLPDITETEQEKLQDRFPSYKEQAVLFEFVSRTLSMDIDDLSYIMVVMVKDFKDLLEDGMIIKIRNFLDNNVVDDSWKNEILRLFQTRPLKIKRKK